MLYNGNTIIIIAPVDRIVSVIVGGASWQRRWGVIKHASAWGGGGMAPRAAYGKQAIIVT